MATTSVQSNGTARPRQRLGERLIAAGLISQAQLEMALREQKRRGGLLGQVLAGLGFVTPDVVADYVAKEAEAQVVNLRRLAVDPAVLGLVSVGVAKRLKALPIS